MSRIVAIVGRPNVGKSRLFNRLARKRISIVHDQPGVTRDVISAEVAEGSYTLLDTGGLGYRGEDTPAALTKASEQQVEFAMSAADLILFVVDGLTGLSSLDEKIAQLLRRSKKQVLLVVNKADFGDEKVALDEAYKLGFGEPLRVSAEHGRGEADLRAAIAAAALRLYEEAREATAAAHAAGREELRLEIKARADAAAAAERAERPKDGGAPRKPFGDRGGRGGPRPSFGSGRPSAPRGDRPGSADRGPRGDDARGPRKFNPRGPRKSP